MFILSELKRVRPNVVLGRTRFNRKKPTKQWPQKESRRKLEKLELEHIASKEEQSNV